LRIVDRPECEREAEAAADAIALRRPMPTLKEHHPPSILRQKLGPDEPPRIDRDYELPPHVVPMDAPAVPEREAGCEEFPGGSTECEVDEKTGTLTGRVTQRIDETNACTRPCVEQHEAVHVKQLKTFCPKLRDCYLAADKGKGSPIDCYKLAASNMKERECAAYQVSVACVEKRLRTAKECHSKENQAYGTRKLASEKCFRDKNCGSPSGK
jgi:hypothetical protein